MGDYGFDEPAATDGEVRWTVLADEHGNEVTVFAPNATDLIGSKYSDGDNDIMLVSLVSL